MIRHYVHTVEENGTRWAEACLVLQLFGREFVLSKAHMAIASVRPERKPPRRLYMTVHITTPVYEGESQQDAEDRVMDMTDSYGVYVLGWDGNRTRIEDWEDDDGV